MILFGSLGLVNLVMWGGAATGIWGGVGAGCQGVGWGMGRGGVWPRQGVGIGRNGASPHAECTPNQWQRSLNRYHN